MIETTEPEPTVLLKRFTKIVKVAQTLLNKLVLTKMHFSAIDTYIKLMWEKCGKIFIL